MDLPNLDFAKIPERKISGYLLAVDHPTVRAKARLFIGLGFRSDQPSRLRTALLQHAADNEVGSIQLTVFGAKYLIDGCIVGPMGTSAHLRSLWFIEAGQRGPRLITAHPLRGVQT
jgi:hypothetical protein